MQAATIAHIKKELKEKGSEELMQLCLRLARFKKDNKELLTYLLFEMNDEQAYVSSIQNYIDEALEETNTSHFYFAKKTIRKVLRNVNKMIRYSGNKQTEVEVLIHFCRALKALPLAIERSTVLSNLFDRQVAKIRKTLNSLHEDLQADYLLELDDL